MAIRGDMPAARRTFLLAIAIVVAAMPSCKEESGVGDPCVPEKELDPTFGGFDENEVTTESKSFQCRTRLCLVNHFRGRVSCPYGQTETGAPNDPSGKACTVPGTTTPVTGDARDPRKQKRVQAQCVDRTTDRAVYCSCRCADAEGNRPSDQTFCDCPDGFQCTRLVGSNDRGNEGLTGSYCIKKATEVTLEKPACAQGACEAAHPCP